MDYDGIPTYRFDLDRSVFSSAQENPDNACFCSAPDKCLRSGLIDVSECQGAEMFLSNPHFLDGDPSLMDAVEGMHPDQERHRGFMDIEPVRYGVQFTSDLEV